MELGWVALEVDVEGVWCVEKGTRRSGDVDSLRHVMC